MSEERFETAWARPVRRAMILLAAMTAVLYLILVVAGIVLYLVLNRQAQQGEQAHDANCALRADLERRVQTAKDFVDDLEAGRREPIPGISRADLEVSITNQQKTIEALAGLDCGT